MTSRIDQIVYLATLAGRRNDPKLRAVLRALSVRPNPRIENMLVRQLTIQAGDDAFDPPPFACISEPDMSIPGTEGIPYINFGHAGRFDGSELTVGSRFRRPLLTSHEIHTGGTRSGKSVSVADLIRNLPESTRAWILDPENDPVYANLALAFPEEEFAVIDVRNMKRNLLEGPPGFPQDVWFNHFKRNLRESLFLRDGSMAMLSMLLHRCQEERPEGIALGHVFDKLVEMRYRLIQAGREYTFYETLRNRFEGLLVNPMFDCVKGFDLAELATKHVLFQCGGLGADEFPLYVNDLLCWLSCFCEPSLNPVPKLLVVVEEAHRIVNPGRLRRADIAEPIILDAVRTLAKRRVSLLFVDQVVSELPVQILANCSFRVVFSTIEGRDLDALQRSLGLTLDQRVFVSRLPRRTCIVQYANPNFPEPFPVVVDEFPLRPDIGEELEARRTATRAKLSFVPLERQRIVSGRGTGKTETAPPIVSKPALDYLVEIAKDQFLPASRRDQEVGIPLSQGNALRKELQEAGLLRVEHVNTYGKARRIINTRITEQGYELLGSMEVRCERPRGKGGWEHLYHQRAIAAWGRANGYEVAIEHTVGGKSVDVCLEKDGERIAAEILCHGVHKEVANLRDLHTGFSEVWFCVKDREEARRLQELIVATFREEAHAILTRVRFKLLGAFQDAGAAKERLGREGG
jgi:hypothetical protein